MITKFRALKRQKIIHTNSDYFSSSQLFMALSNLQHKTQPLRIKQNLLSRPETINAYRQLVNSHIIIPRIKNYDINIEFTKRGRLLQAVYRHVSKLLILFAALIVICSFYLKASKLSISGGILFLISSYLILSWPFLYFYCLPRVLNDYIIHDSQPITKWHTFIDNQKYLPEIRLIESFIFITIIVIWILRA